MVRRRMMGFALLTGLLAGCADEGKSPGWQVTRDGDAFTVVGPDGDAVRAASVSLERSGPEGVARQALSAAPGGEADVIKCKNCTCTGDFCVCDECTIE